MMEQEDLINAVNKIHASAELKDKAMSGEPAPRRRKPIYAPLMKCAACLAVVAVIAVGAIHIPQVLKPVTQYAPKGQTQSDSSSTALGRPGMVNGLYHDDAIQNILVLGVDNNKYSDSMLMVSIDKRHNKLKVTSFLRDLYVSVPGYEKNRLGTVYSLGKAPLTVKTIESNFGIDIDNYMAVDYSAFAKIVERVGGVSLTVTATEAKLINRYSGESSNKSLTAGTSLLTCKQALYYSRIRVIDSDFGRTERQRKVVFAIVNKLKSSNLGTMNTIMNDVLPLVTTNMDKNAVVSLIQNSITSMNYPVSQNRLPADSTYQEKQVMIDGTSECFVLDPDLKANKQLLAKFIYENDFSFLTASGDSNIQSK